MRFSSDLIYIRMMAESSIVRNRVIFQLVKIYLEIIVTNIYDTFHLQAEMHPDRDHVRAAVITGAHVCNLNMQICRAAHGAGH